MSTYFFLLGNTPALSLAELQVFFPAITLVLPHIAQLSSDAELDATQLINTLGGTVKILRYRATATDPTPEGLTTTLIDTLSGPDKVSFALAEHGRDHLPAVSTADIKQGLVAQGMTCRYRDGSRSGLSAAILLNHAITELHVIQTASQVVIAETVAVQNIDDWSFRDRGKPYANSKKGMLPPKVARIMVNLAVGATPGDALVYDPFCGTGTVLMEAALRGCQVVGSDLDEDAVRGTTLNLQWLADQYHLPVAKTVIWSDVANVKLQQLPQAVTHLVSEPFLGKPSPKPPELPNIFKGLEKMYLGAFKNWTKLLADQATLVVILPYVENKNHIHSFEQFIDKIAPLGYTIISEPIMYHRPQAVVQRQIYRLRFNKG